MWNGITLDAPLGRKLWDDLFFLRIIQYNADTHNARTLIPMNARAQILPLWASSKIGPANHPWNWRSHHRRLAVDQYVVYRWKYNAVKSWKIRSHGESNLGPKVLLRHPRGSAITGRFWAKFVRPGFTLSFGPGLPSPRGSAVTV